MSMFGCERHGGRLFADHTHEERWEDGYAEVTPGVWKERNGADSAVVVPGLPIREFDSGVVPDLHNLEIEEAWKARGLEYVPGVGPVIRDNQELKEALEIGGFNIHGQSRMVEEKRKGIYGYESDVLSKKRKESHFEPVWGKFRRDPEHVMKNRVRREEKFIAQEHRESEEREKAAANARKKFFFLP